MTENWHERFNVLIFNELDSTSDEAKRIALRGLMGEFLIWTHYQKNGRGRCGKKWQSGVGNLTFSILMRPKIQLMQASQLVFVVGCVLRKVISDLSNNHLDIKYKWPNDLMINDHKIAGILLEAKQNTVNNLTDWIIIGVGVNIQDYPELNNAYYQATSLSDCGMINIDSGTIIDKFMNLFLEYYNRWYHEGFEWVRDLWVDNAYKLDKPVAVMTGNERVCGIFKNINIDGMMELELADGSIKNISAGEVFFDEIDIPDIFKIKE
jgi:BirA family transcriptional regulator, biotin operon repressor / biotin---[acetyl-CoA-carboxylase] ligase